MQLAPGEPRSRLGEVYFRRFESLEQDLRDDQASRCAYRPPARHTRAHVGTGGTEAFS